MINNRLDNQLTDLLTKSDYHFIILKNKVEQFIKMRLQNINDYKKIYVDLDESWYDQFIYLRIESKKKEGMNPNLTNNDIKFLREESNFCNYFKDYMKNKMYCQFFVHLENDILNSTRLKSIDDELGKPNLNNEIRQNNINYIKNITHQTDGIYTIIKKYIDYIEKYHNNMNFEQFILNL